MVNEARSVLYRASESLSTPEQIQEYLNAALEDGNERVVLRALRNVAEAMGNSIEPGALTEASLDSLKSAEVDPRLSRLNAALKAMGWTLAVRPHRDAA